VNTRKLKIAVKTDNLVTFLRKELAPFPERQRTFVRLLIEVSLLMLIFASLGFEFFELAVVIAFLIGAKPPEEGPRPYLVLGLAGTAAIGFIFPYYAFTYNSPALRIAAGFGAAFFFLWISQISPRLRSTGIIAAVVFVFAQSFFDKIPDAEIIVRLCIYLWRALIVSLVVLAAADALILPSKTKPVIGPLLEKDALKNPAYIAAAFRSTLAGFICYVFYCGTAWFAIHTCMITCFVLALPAREEALHKKTLRIAGCLVGSALAYAAAILIFPHLDSIAGILIMSLICLAPCAWIAAGSARISYAGCQMALAYAFALCSNYMFYLDMGEISGRILGILIGTAVSSILSSVALPQKRAYV
jgi:uncharacterized membrane protein YccC